MIINLIVGAVLIFLARVLSIAISTLRILLMAALTLVLLDPTGKFVNWLRGFGRAGPAVRAVLLLFCAGELGRESAR